MAPPVPRPRKPAVRRGSSGARQRRPRAATHTPRAERTRAAILEAAELLFAERGFEATRLEDVAEQVGIRRASIVYYFRGKRELYDAVLGNAFGALHAHLTAAITGDGTLTTRIEAAVSAWVEFVGRRPTLARLLLREVADASPSRPPALLAHLRPFFELAEKLEAESRSSPVAVASIDPIQVASAIVGSTVFFVAAMPALLPGSGFDPLRVDQIESHRQEVLRMTRRLLRAQPRANPSRRRKAARGRG